MKPSIKHQEAAFLLNATFKPIITFNKVTLAFGTNWEEVLRFLYRNTKCSAGTELDKSLAKQLKKAKLIKIYAKQKNRYKASDLFLNSFDELIDACHESIAEVSENYSHMWDDSDY